LFTRFERIEGLHDLYPDISSADHLVQELAFGAANIGICHRPVKDFCIRLTNGPEKVTFWPLSSFGTKFV
jgi:hypothetical protein